MRTRWAVALVLGAVGVLAAPRVSQATPQIGITTETLNRTFNTAATTGSYNHQVLGTGSNRILIVTLGMTNSTANITSIVWDPNTSVSGDEQTLTCPAALNLAMGTNRRIAICTLLNPTVSTGLGLVTITLTGADTFTSSATTMTGVASTGSLTGSPVGKTFNAWSACVGAGATMANYTCTVPLTTVVDQVLFDLIGQGEPSNDTTRTYTASGTGQNKHEDSASLNNNNNDRVATSITIATGTSTSLVWFCGGSGATNGVGQVILTLTAASSVTAARPVGLGAVRYGALGTRVAWRTEEEVSHLGFEVWREVGGVRERLGQGLLPGSMFATGDFPLAGRRPYELWDPRPPPDARYWLEEIGTLGASRWHGPLVPTTGDVAHGRALRALPVASAAIPRGFASSSEDGVGLAPARLAALRTNPLVRAAPAPSAFADPACGNPAAGVASVKLGISAPGWYHVDAAALFDAGLPTDADPARLALYADGQPVALEVFGQPRLEAVEFYGAGLDTRETATRVYWLVAHAPNARRVSTAGPLSPGVVSTRYAATVERRERTIYFAALLNGAADNFFGATLTSAPVTQTLDVTAPALDDAAGATLEVSLQGATLGAHDVQISWAGVSLGELTWAGRAAATRRFDVPMALVRAGAGDVVLTPATGAGGASLVEHVSLTYPRLFATTSETLEAVLPAGATATLTGFASADVRVVDLRDPRTPIELPVEVAPANGGFAARVTVPANGAEHPVLAFTPAGRSSADTVTANRPSSLCSTRGAELAVVAPRAFFEALAPFVAARVAAGWTVDVIDVDDVYDEMSYGAHAAAALGAFVRTRLRRPSAPRLRDLLLVGDASLDPRNFLGKDAPDIVPTRLVDSPTIETASDDALADLDSDGLPEIAVGRWPAHTADDVTGFVTRTLELETKTPFSRGSLVIAGARAGDGFDFAPAAAAVLAAAPGAGDLVNAAALPDARATIATLWSRGPSFVTFLGHGSQGVWEGLLSMDDLSGTGPVGAPSVVASMTCLNGFFHDVYQDCLAERLMRADNGPAAVWASATLEDAGTLSQLALAFETALASQSLGEAARQAKAAFPGADMVLFGDPTLFGRPTPEPSSAAPPSKDTGPTPTVGESAPATSTDPVHANADGHGCAVGGAARGWESGVLVIALLAARRRRPSRTTLRDPGT